MKNLTDINLKENQISNVSILTRMKSLEKINVDFNGNILCSCDIVDFILKRKKESKSFKGECVNKHQQRIYKPIHTSGKYPGISNESYHGCACQSNQCFNHGKCNVHNITSYNLTCTSDYTGDHCQFIRGNVLCIIFSIFSISIFSMQLPTGLNISSTTLKRQFK